MAVPPTNAALAVGNRVEDDLEDGELRADEVCCHAAGVSVQRDTRDTAVCVQHESTGKEHDQAVCLNLEQTCSDDCYQGYREEYKKFLAESQFQDEARYLLASESESEEAEGSGEEDEDDFERAGNDASDAIEWAMDAVVEELGISPTDYDVRVGAAWNLVMKSNHSLRKMQARSKTQSHARLQMRCVLPYATAPIGNCTEPPVCAAEYLRRVREERGHLDKQSKDSSTIDNSTSDQEENVKVQEDKESIETPKVPVLQLAWAKEIARKGTPQQNTKAGTKRPRLRNGSSSDDVNKTHVNMWIRQQTKENPKGVVCEATQVKRLQSWGQCKLICTIQRLTRILEKNLRQQKKEISETASRCLHACYIVLLVLDATLSAEQTSSVRDLGRAAAEAIGEHSLQDTSRACVLAAQVLALVALKFGQHDLAECRDGVEAPSTRDSASTEATRAPERCEGEIPISL